MENLTDKQLYIKEQEDLARDLNLKIMQVTQEIRNYYPELTKFLEEMPVTIPNDKNMEITLEVLQSYYESLTTILNDYITEQA